MKKTNLIFAALFFTSGISTQVYAKNFCEDMESFSQELIVCEDNDVISGAAAHCLQQTRLAVKAAALGVAANVDTISDKNKLKQAKTMSASEFNYNLSKNTLDALIATAKASREEVAGYTDYLLEPEDSDEDDVNEGSKKNYLNKNACFQENAELIKAVVSEYDDMIKSLIMARNASVSNETNSAQYKTNIENTTQNKAADQQKTTILPNSPTKKTLHKASDISGTEEEKNKKK